MDIDRAKSFGINCWILYGAHASWRSEHPGATERPDKLDVEFQVEVATELDGWKIAKRLLSFSNYRDFVFWVEPFSIGFTTAEDFLNCGGWGYDEKTEKYKAKRYLGHTEEYSKTLKHPVYTANRLPDPDSFIAGPDFVDPRHGGHGKKFPGVPTRWAFQKEWNASCEGTFYKESVVDFYKENPTTKHPSWIHPEKEQYPFDDNDPNRP